MSKIHSTFTSQDMLTPLMNRRKLNDHEITPPLGNGCFNYPTSTAAVLAANPSVPDDLSHLSPRRSPTKSRMETFYLPSKDEDEHVVNSCRGCHHQAALKPSTTPTSNAIHLDQMVEDKDGDLLDLSPGWRFRLIKKTPTTHVTDSIWAKYPPLALPLRQLQQQQQRNPFPSTRTTNGIWAPWWFPAPAPAPVTSASKSSVSSISSINLIPCDMLSSPSSSSYLDSDSNRNLSTSNNYNKKAQEGYLTTYGSSTTSTAADAVALTAMDRPDLFYKDTVFHYTTFASANSSSSSNINISRRSSRDSFQALSDTQYDISQDVQQHESEDQDQDQDQTIFDNEMLIAVPRLFTTTTPTTTSMELTDPLGASSPTLPEPLYSTTESTTPSTIYHPGDNSILSKDVNHKHYHGSPAPTGTGAGDRVSVPSYSFASSPPMKSLGISLSYLNSFSSTDTTPARMVVVAEAMDRIRHDVTLASVELGPQKAYMAMSNRLVQMLRLDEEEEKRTGDGEGNGVDDDDPDMAAEVQERTFLPVPSQAVDHRQHEVPTTNSRPKDDCH
ncbi:hypothetical protein EC957_000253 [Mortierella hygrophila]|uniref:Uncharacterized protein n=1 Tax=Mortierella hygrophila TaxID=979708 RepID=A0A9P6K800_9FUNG|nr:hypothetical protein EC957_000253 [Mortierella hygrophila]